jgi:hypothetical protein
VVKTSNEKLSIRKNTASRINEIQMICQVNFLLVISHIPVNKRKKSDEFKQENKEVGQVIAISVHGTAKIITAMNSFFGDILFNGIKQFIFSV